MTLIVLILFAYLAGSVNFAILLLKRLNREDPRTQFSGNAGTTNVWRQAGKGWASVVLLLDVGRAAGLAALALHFLPVALVPWVGTALILGNRFPCFHQFQGGKGVASFLGFTIPLAPWSVVLSCLVWVILYGIVQIPFIASFGMILILGAATVAVNDPRLVPAVGTAVSVLLIFFNHRKNIARWLAERRQKR